MRNRAHASAGSRAVAVTSIMLAVLVMAPAAASAARATAPSIRQIAVNSQRIKPSGVAVTVSASTTHARYCRLSVSPAVGTQTKPHDCSKNFFSQVVRIPPNNKPFIRHYRFTVKASGRGGSITRSVAVAQLPDEPTITKPTISPSRPAHYGGAITLSATLHSTVWCWLTATKGVRVSTKRFHCFGANFSHSVTLPENYAAYAKTYAVTLHASNVLAVATTVFNIVLPAAPPSFVSFGARPARVTSAGGTVTVTAQFVRAQRCRFVASPALGTSAAWTACKASLSRTVTVPANHTGAQLTYNFTVVLRGRGGTATEQYSLYEPSS